jgi:hypothetical protein
MIAMPPSLTKINSLNKISYQLKMLIAATDCGGELRKSLAGSFFKAAEIFNILFNFVI